MTAANSYASFAVFGDKRHVSVSRALGELQARTPVRVNTPDDVLFTLPEENLDGYRLQVPSRR